jgi:hypothetical protein
MTVSSHRTLANAQISIAAAQPGEAIEALQGAPAVADPMGTGFFGLPIGASQEPGALPLPKGKRSLTKDALGTISHAPHLIAIVIQERSDWDAAGAQVRRPEVFSRPNCCPLELPTQPGAHLLAAPGHDVAGRQPRFRRNCLRASSMTEGMRMSQESKNASI